MQVLRQAWADNNGERTGRALYDSEFRRHWVGLDQGTRSDELVKLIQWHNLTSEVDSDSPEIAIMRALLAEKVNLLSWAHDQTYGTDFVERVYRDPLQFGVHQLEG